MENVDPQLLHDAASAVERRPMAQPLTDEEVAERQASITELIMLQSSEDETFGEIRKQYTDLKKARKGKVEEMAVELKSGYVERDLVCYDMADIDEGVMRTYDEHGNYINERKLRPSERQYSTNDIHRIEEANNG